MRLLSVAPGSTLIWPGSDASLRAIAVVDQIGFARDENGSGMVCSIIQKTGKRIASENRFRSGAIDEIWASGPITAIARVMAAARATACCARAPLAIARIGVAASNIVRR